MSIQNKDRDATEEFLKSLPELKPGETFQFACHPGVPCFNACCGDLNLVLTPYDVQRLRKGLGLSSKELFASFIDIFLMQDTGLPSLQLRMTDGRGRPCPFVSDKGCTIYNDRPGACRTYPLGRASKLAEDGAVVEQFFVVKEPHCMGFKEDKHWTPDEWLCDQGLEPYNRLNDSYVTLLAKVKKAKLKIPPQQANMALLALYQSDNFLKFCEQMEVFSRFDLESERLVEIRKGKEELLLFALGWIETILFGEAEGLKKRDK